MTKNGLCPNTSESRFCGPLPLIKITIGKVLSISSGKDSVPDKFIPSLF
nr:hypothetical protein [Aquimarina intermedia]